jgi:hypothetical protein
MSLLLLTILLLLDKPYTIVILAKHEANQTKTKDGIFSWQECAVASLIKH